MAVAARRPLIARAVAMKPRSFRTLLNGSGAFLEELCELCGILGDGVNQAADFFSDATSIPSRNVTPLTTFGN